MGERIGWQGYAELSIHREWGLKSESEHCTVTTDKIYLTAVDAEKAIDEMIDEMIKYGKKHNDVYELSLCQFKGANEVKIELP